MASSTGVMSPRSMRSRTHSISSDRPSTIGLSLVSPPLNVSPEAVYIAASAASQIVTNDHDSHADAWYDQHGIEPAGETAMISAAALQLVNSFIDQLLFNFLQVSKATTLVALRPAVTEVLKPKLAKDAINNADEELREYLGGADEDDYVQPQGSKSPRDWDLELVWKRTRLRCMVYSSLGDMEEEDEDIYMEQENLEIGADEQISDVISPAVAIFLTSVLEYMGELTLTVAGQAAYHRMRVRFEKELREGTREPTDLADRILVDDVDMERVALDRTLGRLWRGWKKRIRAPGIDAIGRPYSRSSNGHMRHDSSATELLYSRSPAVYEMSKGQREDGEPEAVEAVEAKVNPFSVRDLQPHQLPLPLGESEDEDGAPTKPRHRRPQSVHERPGEMSTEAPPSRFPAVLTRQRSSSVPSPLAKWLLLNKVGDERRASQLGSEANSSMSGDVDRQEDGSAQEAGTGNRVAKIAEGALAAGAAAVAGVAAMATGKSTQEQTSELDAEKNNRPEMTTSSRMSVSSNSPALPEAGQRFSSKRSSSAHSGRIIEVTGPRSPARSASPTANTSERRRQLSIAAGAGTVSPPSSGDEGDWSKVSAAPTPFLESMPTYPEPTPTYPTSKTPQYGGSAIPERAEETDLVPALSVTDMRPEPYNFSKPSPVVHGTYGVSNVNWSPVRHKSTPSATKVTIIGSTAESQPTEDKTPDIPQRASARVSTKSDGTIPGTLERTLTKDSDDEQLLPLQSNASQRQTHTSGSSASSGTGRIRAIRTSEEHMPSHAESVARNFEDLIQSNQTITYTLTPENMRDINSKQSLDGQSGGKLSRKSDDFRNSHRSRSSSANDFKTAAGAHRPTPLSSHPISEDASSPITAPISPGSQYRQPRLSTQARDPRAPGESTAEIADFIKSTGPPGAEMRGPPPPRVVASYNNANQSVPNSPVKTSTDTRRASTTNRSRFQAREAAVNPAEGSSDLIDFLRQGPPGGGAPATSPTAAMGNSYAPRHMAPTSNGRGMDSAAPEIRYSQASTNVTDNSMPSMQSSVNSSSALLKKKPPTTAPSKMFDEDDMMPVRKTRRVKDPYAIDFSDEEDDDELLAVPRPPPKKEESLADFLRDFEPPPEPEPAPIVVPQQKPPKKKSSTPSLMGRLTRGYYHRDHSSSSSTSQSASRLGINARPEPAPAAPASNGAARGHIPIQVNMSQGYDQYGAVDNGAPRVRAPPSAGSAGRVPMKKFEPREAVSDSPKTSDLAAFLRDSGPPDAGISPVSRTDSSDGPRKLGRRRKPGFA